MKKEKVQKKEEGPKLKVPLVDKDWEGGTFAFIPIFDQMVTLFVGKRQDAFKYLERPEKEGDEFSVLLAGAKGMAPVPNWKGETVTLGATSLMLLRRIDLSDQDSVATLYHEALHAALVTLRRTGTEIGEHGEILAYLQGYIVNRLLGNLKSGTYGTLGEDGKRYPNIKPEELKL